MKLRAFLCATAVTVASFTPTLPIAAPAFAQDNNVDENGQPWFSGNPHHNLVGNPGETPQEVCDRALRPATQSGFTTHPTGQTTSISDSAPVPEATPYRSVLAGDPVYSDFGSFGTGYHRNGGSPNIWTDGTARTATYPRTDNYYRTTFVRTTTALFGCHVHKDTRGTVSHHIEPPGLQSTGHSTVLSQQTLPGNDLIVAGPGGSVSVGEYIRSILICISPNNVTKGKPGTWKEMHGFPAGKCPEADAAVHQNVPSGNDP